MKETEKKHGKPSGGRLRSPPYPFISLSKAIDRISTLHGQAQCHAVDKTVLASVWGYSVKSSGFIQTTSTLINFGLLKGEGVGEGRRFQLTNDALRIIQDADPTSEKRKEALVRAALSPKIYKELWERYGISAGDIVLKNYLTLDRRESGEAPFSSSAAEDLISAYKETLDFVEIKENTASLSEKEGIKKEENVGQGNVHASDNPLSLPNWQNQPESAAIPSEQVEIMQGERVIFTEEESPQHHLRLIVAGELNDYLLEALGDFIKRQRKRLGIKETE